MGHLPRVAIVHDYLVATGGAERVLLSIHRLYPEAPIYTSIFRPESTLPEFRDLDIRPLWTDRLPLSLRTYRPAVPAFAAAFEGLVLEGTDMVLSASSGFAKSAGARARSRVCYCYTPPRFIWPCGTTSELAGRAELVGRWALRPWLRSLDLAAARRVDRFAVTSRLVQSRVREFYSRDSKVIHPPIELERFNAELPRDGGYLVVGRLTKYRGFDTVVRTLSALNRPLTVVGTGPEDATLGALAGPTVSFAGRVSDAELTAIYGRARALIVPGEEDWGLAALEANASGCPVIAAAVGGSLETVVDGVTGILFDPGDPAGLDRAVERFEASTFSAPRLQEHAARFSESAFHAGLGGLVEGALVAA